VPSSTDISSSAVGSSSPRLWVDSCRATAIVPHT
jgi:hypothetical protein